MGVYRSQSVFGQSGLTRSLSAFFFQLTRDMRIARYQTGDDDQRIFMMAPRVLISDSLSPAAIAIFKERGVEVDFQPDLGKDKDRLASIIDQYDGLAIRSATKVTAKILENATRLKVVGRAGIGDLSLITRPAAIHR